MTTIVTRLAKGSPLSWTEADANFINLNTDKAEVSVVALKAPLASPNLTGVPTAPTATNGTNTTQLATTAFVQAKTATQTPSTAVGNIAATNVQAALEELDTEKASLTGATFSGQVTATKLQTGVSGTNTNNFILDASAADGTMKLERGDGQDIMTVAADGKVSFPQNTFTQLENTGFNPSLATQTNTALASVTLTPGTWLLTGQVDLQSTAALITWLSIFLNSSSAIDAGSYGRSTYVPWVVLNTGANGAPSLTTSRMVTVIADTVYSVYCNHAFSNGNPCGAAGRIHATRIG